MPQSLLLFRPWALLTIGAILLLPRPAQAVWQSFSPANGLADGLAHGFAEDPSHAIWVASESGVSRYDGLRWQPYVSAVGIPSMNCNAVLADPAGRIWVATNSGMVQGSAGARPGFAMVGALPPVSWTGLIEDAAGDIWSWSWGFGVARFDTASGNWTRFIGLQSLPSDQVNDVIATRDGSVWCATQAGIAVYRDGAWQPPINSGTTGGKLLDDHVNGLFEDSSGRIWCRTGSAGVSVDSSGVWTPYERSPAGPLAGEVTAIQEGPDGDLWFATVYSGVQRFRSSTGAWAQFTIPDLATNQNDAIFRDRLGFLWCTWSSSTQGISRFDGFGWRTFTESGGLGSSSIGAMFQDSAGNLWFGTRSGVARTDQAEVRAYTSGSGLSAASVYATALDSSGGVWCGTEAGARRFDGTSWSSLNTAALGASSSVNAILVRASGETWFATSAGALRCLDGTCSLITAPDSLPGNRVLALFEDVSHRVWAGTNAGAAVRDAAGWIRYGAGTNSGNGLLDPQVNGITQAPDGAMWFATNNGASRLDPNGTWSAPGFTAGQTLFAAYSAGSDTLWFGSGNAGALRWDGSAWRAYSKAEGLPNDIVFAFIEDANGVLWCGTKTGLARFDGTRWIAYTPADGLAGEDIRSLSADARSRVWVGAGGAGGLTEDSPDRVAPRALFTPLPPRASGALTQTVTVSPYFGEQDDLTYDFFVDGVPLAVGVATPYFNTPVLPDSFHVIACRARDRGHNVQADSTAVVIDMDRTPPLAVIASPGSGSAVRDSITVLGSTWDARYFGHDLLIRRVGDDPWQAGRQDTLVRASVAVTDTLLRRWNTKAYDDGDYELRLEVADTLGLTGTAIAHIIVDNQAPAADRTSPALISAAEGGDAYTTRSDAHAYFPPHSFALDATVTLHPIRAPGVPDPLPDGAHWIGDAFDVSWGSQDLAKTAVLDFALPAVPGIADSSLSIYGLGADSTWARIGGNLNEAQDRLVVPLRAPGRYAIGSGGSGLPGPAPGTALLTGLALSPRVLRGAGGTGTNLSFSLARTARVQVSVFNRAGRRVREVLPATELAVGAHVIAWDGSDADSRPVPDGAYIVVITLPDHTETMPVYVAIAGGSPLR